VGLSYLEKVLLGDSRQLVYFLVIAPPVPYQLGANPIKLFYVRYPAGLGHEAILLFCPIPDFFY